MNVYDFDKTLYRHDSTVQFYFYEIGRHPALLRYLPGQLAGFIGYGLKLIDITSMKGRFYRYLTGIKDVEQEVEEFWDKNMKDMNSFYDSAKQEDDVVISGSARFMITPACRRLGISNVIASEVDCKTGKTLGPNCSRKQKPVEFKAAGYDVNDIDEFYSDSHNDDPMAKLARKAWLIRKGIPEDWGEFHE